VGNERLEGCLGTLPWGDPHRDLGSCNRNQLIDRMTDRWGVYGEHCDRRLPPEASRQTSVAEEFEAFDRPCLFPQFILSQVEIIAFPCDETCDRHVSFVVVE